MDEQFDTPFTDAEVRTAAEREAKAIFNTTGVLWTYFVRHWPGPLGYMQLCAKMESEALTMRQRAMIVKIVGAAFERGRAERNEEKDDGVLARYAKAQRKREPVDKFTRDEMRLMKQRGRDEALIRGIRDHW